MESEEQLRREFLLALYEYAKHDETDWRSDGPVIEQLLQQGFKREAIEQTITYLARRGSIETGSPRQVRFTAPGFEEAESLHRETAESEPPAAAKYGARVYLMGDGVVLIYQTIKRGSRYVIDRDIHQHVDPGDDAALGREVRKALNGQLRS